MKKGLRWVRVTNKGGGRGNRVAMCTVDEKGAEMGKSHKQRGGGNRVAMCTVDTKYKFFML